MKVLKKIAAAGLSLCLCMGIAACGNGGNKNEPDQLNTSLTIAVYDGGYGTEWLEHMKAKFSEKEGIIMEVKPNVDLLPSLSSDLDAGEIDLFISHGLPWETHAAEGKIEPLDDLYESKMSDGTTKFADRVIDVALKSSKAGGHYYKVPWTQGVGGMVYNVKMFEENGWEVPETYEELVALCKTIDEANLKITVSGKEQKVTPFIWPGVDQFYWDYIFYEWWGQLAGTEKIQNFLQYESADVFDPDGDLGYKEFEKAYLYWYDLVALNKNYTAPGSDGMAKYDAQVRFTNGWAAMMPNAQWLNNEIKKYAPDGFEMAMFPAPTLPDAKEGYEKVNFSVGFGDSIILSRKSKNKDLAKKFLRFMAEEENCLAFSEDVPGTSLAFKYDMKQTAKDNKFAQSVAQILNECVSFNIYSTSKIAQKLGSETLNPWPNNTFFYKSSWQNPEMYTPSKIVDDIYAEVSRLWPNWVIQ